jgi:hypothetical protein
MKERENLYMTSPIDLINYIQTSVEILMNIKVEDYIANKKEKERKEKQFTRKNKKNPNNLIQFNEWAKVKESSK